MGSWGVKAVWNMLSMLLLLHIGLWSSHGLMRDGSACSRRYASGSRARCRLMLGQQMLLVHGRGVLVGRSLAHDREALPSIVQVAGV